MQLMRGQTSRKDGFSSFSFQLSSLAKPKGALQNEAKKTQICQPLNRSNLLFRSKRVVLGLIFAKKDIFLNLPSLAPLNEFKEFITFYLYIIPCLSSVNIQVFWILIVGRPSFLGCDCSGGQWSSGQVRLGPDNRFQAIAAREFVSVVVWDFRCSIFICC